jgi:hypothetical protein
MNELSDDDLQSLLAGLRAPPPDGGFEQRLRQGLLEVEREGAGAVVVRGPWGKRRTVALAVAAALVLAAAAAALWSRSSSVTPVLEAEHPLPQVAPSQTPPQMPAQDRETPAPIDRQQPPAPRRSERLEPRSLPAPAPRAIDPHVEERAAPPPERPRLDRLDITPERTSGGGARSTGARPLPERLPGEQPGSAPRSLPERGREGPGASTTDPKRDPPPRDRRHPSR